MTHDGSKLRNRDITNLDFRSNMEEGEISRNQVVSNSRGLILTMRPYVLIIFVSKLKDLGWTGSKEHTKTSI
jgi:hypothetical protein